MRFVNLFVEVSQVCAIRYCSTICHLLDLLDVYGRSWKLQNIMKVSYLKVSFWWLFYIWLDWLWDAREWGLRSWSTWPQFSRFAMKALWRWAIHFCRYPSLESCANPPFVRWGLSTPEQYATSKKQKIREINVGSYLTYVIWRVFNP